MYSRIEHFTPLPEYKARTPLLTWGSDQWKLFCTFKYCMRKKVTATIQKINVRYETYSEWMKTLQNHCTIHTGFYPEGYHTYHSYCFLCHTDHPQSVQSLFSFLPTTSFIIELPNQLLILVNLISPDIIRKLFCTIYDMKTKSIIKTFHQATGLFHWLH
jgi:hypothetical protein